MFRNKAVIPFSRTLAVVVFPRKIKRCTNQTFFQSLPASFKPRRAIVIGLEIVLNYAESFFYWK